jgi:Ca-activated chloride channel homolog
MNKFQHFNYLQLLWIGIPLVALFVWYMRWRANGIKAFASLHIFSILAPESATKRHYVKFALVILALVALIFGIANPQIGIKSEKVKRRGIDVMIALDVSNSMLAQDVKPTRLDKAKLFISRFLDKLQNDRIGLVVFAGNAYQQVPLTTDYTTVKMYLPMINTGTVPTQGTALGEAVSMAMDGFGENAEDDKALIIITDGEDHDSDAESIVKDAAKRGIRTYTIGVGEEAGGPIPMGNDFKRDEKGEVVITKFNKEMLQSLATMGSGQFYQLAAGNEIVDGLISSLEKIEAKELEDFQFSDYESYFYWLLLIAVILMVAEFFISDRKSNWFESLKLFEKKK